MSNFFCTLPYHLEADHGHDVSSVSISVFTVKRMAFPFFLSFFFTITMTPASHQGKTRSERQGMSPNPHWAPMESPQLMPPQRRKTESFPLRRGKRRECQLPPRRCKTIWTLLAYSVRNSRKRKEIPKSRKEEVRLSPLTGHNYLHRKSQEIYKTTDELSTRSRLT